jgi:DNA-damage-inducible protein J
MKQVTVNFKMNEDTKMRFDAVSNQLGISASTLYNLFAKNVIAYKKLPFSICVEDEQKKEEMFQKLINL